MAIEENVKNAQKVIREISAGIIIYKKDRDGVKFLLLYHGNGYWNFAKGKLENIVAGENGEARYGKESAYRAALREVGEETGLNAKDLRFKEFFKVYDRFSFRRNKDRVFKIVIYYLAETRQSDIKISEEHEGYGWFLYKDAVKLLKYQNLKDNLKQAYDRIRPKNFTRRSSDSPRQNFNLQRSGGPRRPAMPTGRQA